MTGEFLAVGLNHTCAPLELREKLAVPDEEQPALLEELTRSVGFQEAMLLSTCNRVEIYGVAPQWVQASEAALDRLARGRGVDRKQLQGHSFVRGADEAVRHVFRVAASLDSMVVGEPQILGQVKAAFHRARACNAIGPLLDRCMTSAFRGAKRVRAETDIGRGSASVPSVAVELARTIFGDLRGCGALLLGAGEMAEQTGLCLKATGCSELVIVNRSPEKAESIARMLQGRWVEWDRLAQELQRVDIVITSTGSRYPVITRKMVKPVMKARRHKPLFFVDIAVPRDVAADAAELEDVFLYNIDDLQGIVHDNLRARFAEAERAGEVLDSEVNEYLRWHRARSVGPVIDRLRRRAQDITDGEIERALRRLPDLSEAQRDVVVQLGRAIMKKLLHAPTAGLRHAAGSGHQDSAQLTDAVMALFDLADPPQADRDGEPDTPTPAPGIVGQETS